MQDGYGWYLLPLVLVLMEPQYTPTVLTYIYIYVQGRGAVSTDCAPDLVGEGGIIVCVFCL